MTPDDLSREVLARLQEAVTRSTQVVAVKKKPDAQDKEEDVAAREAKAKAKALEEANEDSASFRVLREKYAKWVYRYLIGYSVICALFLMADGWSWGAFDLPDSVLEFLVGSTAASAIGLVLAVTHGLFKK